VDTFTRQADIPKYARMVPLSEIADPKNDFNLNIPRYIDSTEPEDLQDIDGHLRGGIPERDIDDLDRYWQVFPGLRSLLFESAGRPGYCGLKLPVNDLKAAIGGHGEFNTFTVSINALFTQWKQKNAPRLNGFARGDHPKALIETMSEGLLESFRDAPLIDPYDLYQHLMDYWAETMQDDAYMIAADGWQTAAKPRPVVEDKDKKTKEKPDFTVGKQKFKADLIPISLLVARYFAAEQTSIEALEAESAALGQTLEEMTEEHGGEDGLLAEVKNDKGKIPKTAVTARIKEIRGDTDFADEMKMLNECLALIENEAEADGRIKAARKALEAKVAVQYGKLTEADIKAVVVDDKWLAALAAAVQAELDRVSHALTERIRQLAERYTKPLPQLEKEMENLAARVNEHLKKMGAVWS